MILLTGGSGILGSELKNHLRREGEAIFPTKEELDITSEDSVINFIRNHDHSGNSIFHNKNGSRDLIVHCAAFTDLVRAEVDHELAWNTNVIGTRNLASLGIPMLYISTAYVFDGQKGDYEEEDIPNPINFYSLTKLLGEYEARAASRSVVIRCLFKPRPFKHEFACVDQLSTGTYADRAAEEIAIAIRKFDRLPPTLHIGGIKQSTFDLARETVPGIKACRIGDITGVKLSKDVSLNCSLWEKIKNEY